MNDKLEEALAILRAVRFAVVEQVRRDAASRTALQLPDPPSNYWPNLLARLDRAIGHVRHGIDCYKFAHVGDGYLHGPDDDGPYDVDGVPYCGRCHLYLDGPPRAIARIAAEDMLG